MTNGGESMGIPPWVPDWNGNGVLDIGDEFMDYMIFREVTGDGKEEADESDED